MVGMLVTHRSFNLLLCEKAHFGLVVILLEEESTDREQA